MNSELTSARTRIAKSVARAARAAVKMVDPDRGTNLPGRIALGIAPDCLEAMLSSIRGKVLFVSGTNGKTTTAALATACFRSLGREPVNNKAGANLDTGITTALLDADPDADAVIEIDEGALSGALLARAPSTLLLLNLSRDQLDRYGEIDLLMKSWRQQVDRLGQRTRLVLNADDPRVAALGWRIAPSGRPEAEPRPEARFFGFEIDDPSPQRPPVDAAWCPFCGESLEYDKTFSIGGGHFRCTGCEWSRPRPDYRLFKYEGLGFDGTKIAIETPSGMDTLALRLPGLHNAANAIAATAAAVESGISLSEAIRSISESHTAYGRAESVQIDGRSVRLLLSKNPAGLTGSLLLIAEQSRLRPETSPPTDPVLFGLNDKTADGRDISWIWDVDFAGILGPHRPFVTTGRRAASAALRLKYDGWAPEEIEIEPEPYPALRAAVARTPRGHTLSALLTYTAMRELRAELVRRRLAPAIH